MKHRLANKQGYTLVELVLALALYSFVLMVITAGFLTIVRFYRQSLAQRATQQNTRFGMEEIVRAARGAYGAQASPNRLCLSYSGGMVRFWSDGTALRQANIQNYRDPSACSTGTPVGEKVLSSSDVRILEFDPVLIPLAAGNTVPSVRLRLRIATNDPTLLSGNNCLVSQPEAQWCSVTEITSAVSLRGVPN